MNDQTDTDILEAHKQKALAGDVESAKLYFAATRHGLLMPDTDVILMQIAREVHELRQSVDRLRLRESSID